VSSPIFFYVLCAVVGAWRLMEMRLSRRHQRMLSENGAALLPEPAFRAMVALHTAVLGGAVFEVAALHRPFVAALGIPAFVVFLLANALRLWVIATLGVHWNVRVVRSAPLGIVTGGPYRYVRHPNYVAVFAELVALPLVHSAYLTAAVGAALHVLVLRKRIALEESVLMDDAAWNRAFAHKPRFLPWPTR
jgi:methyltransferase